MYPFTFEVCYYDLEDQKAHTGGFLFADSYGEAAEKIAQYFCEDLERIERLYQLEEKMVLEVPRELNICEILNAFEQYNQEVF